MQAAAVPASVHHRIPAIFLEGRKQIGGSIDGWQAENCCFQRGKSGHHLRQINQVATYHSRPLAFFPCRISQLHACPVAYFRTGSFAKALNRFRGQAKGMILTSGGRLAGLRLLPTETRRLTTIQAGRLRLEALRARPAMDGALRRVSVAACVRSWPLRPERRSERDLLHEGVLRTFPRRSIPDRPLTQRKECDSRQATTLSDLESAARPA